MGKKKKKLPSNIIAQNKKARHDYALETEFEAGRYLERRAMIDGIDVCEK